MMTQIALEEQIYRLQKEYLLAAEQTDRRILEQRVEVDRLKLELTALKTFIAAAFPSFAEQFPQVLERTIQEVDPESA